VTISKSIGHLDKKSIERYAHIADKAALRAQEMYANMITRRVQ
jgi:hypothetical protein